MASFVLEAPSPSNGQAAVLSPREQETLVVGQLQAEVDSWYVAMRSFGEHDPSDIFMSLAGISARASELRTQVQRSDNRRLTAFRTRELEPALDEVDRQFKLWSRVQSVRDLEFRLSGGAV